MAEAVIQFRIDARSGVAPYRQIVLQVRHALQLGLLRDGDQLPTVKEVVAQVAINPNTVSKAYRELELEGLVEGRTGVGTFVTHTAVAIPETTQRSLRRELDRWVAKARQAGFDTDGIMALFETAIHAGERGVA
jgi:GntR family transcriptional regulator